MNFKEIALEWTSKIENFGAGNTNSLVDLLKRMYAAGYSDGERDALHTSVDLLKRMYAAGYSDGERAALHTSTY